MATPGYPEDNQAGSPPSFTQQTAQGDGNWTDGGYKAQNIETFDSFYGYVGPLSLTNLSNQTLPRGAINGVPIVTHNAGDPNL